MSEGTNVPNVLTGRGLQRTKKNLGLGYVLDDTKLVSMISKCLLSFYHALLSAKPALTKSMRLWFQTWRYTELGLNFRKDLLIERMLQRLI